MGYLNFGYTWWGNKWLNALLSTDYSNRLPRGKSYARNGSVKNIYISYKGVMGIVQGSRPKPYSISLVLKSFTQKDKDTILAIILNNPLYLSSLLNRKLPEQLYQEFEEKKVKLFPENWSDISADCSCPDWADCCKHIAAIIYMIANEIDKNPFLVFELHGLDIFAELKKQGYFLEEDTSKDIIHINQWLDLNPLDKNYKKWTLDIDLLKTINFTQIPFLQDQLISLLDENPLFYPKNDFKKLLHKMYKGVSKYAEIAHNKMDQQFFSSDLDKIEKISLMLDASLNETIVIEQEDFTAENFYKNSREFDSLYNQLVALPVKSLNNQSDYLIIFHMVMIFSIKLLQQGAFIPEIVEIANDTYRLRWLPALLNKEVTAIFSQLLTIIPPEIVKIQDKSKSASTLKPEEVLKLLISLFLEYFISKYCREEIKTDRHNPVLSFFFAGDFLDSKSFVNKELPTTISLWLSKFHLTHKAYIPVIKIEEILTDFEVSILIENQNKTLDAPIPLEYIFTKKEYQSIALSVFKDLQMLEEYFPDIASILKSKGQEKLSISAQELPDIIFKQLPILKMLGIPLLLPKGLENIVFPKLSLSVKKRSESTTMGASYLSLQDLLDFDWEIALGDTHLKIKDFRQLLKNSKGIVKIKDQYVYFNEKEIEKLLKKIDNEPRLSSIDKLRSVISEQYKGSELNMSQAVKDMLAEIHQVEKVTLPKTLQASLRPYQLRGYEWLYKNTKFGFGSLIADDMGLGKTVQVIAYLLKIQSEGKLKKHPALVVVPTSLLSNWQKELTKFAPILNVHIYHGSKRELALTGKDVFITSYGLVRSNINKFSEFKWPALIIDEAQNIKNHQTAQTKSIKQLKADVKIAMTGTPVENRLSEYWSIIDFLNKGYLGNTETFQKEFSIPIEVDRDQKTLNIFKKMTAPFILRRLKTDRSIIKDLPDKIEIDQFNQLSKQQTALYQSVLDNIMEQIEKEEGINRKGLIFKLMTSLKQICNHPAHFQKKKEIDPDLSGKTGVLMELLENIFESNEKVLIFTQYKEMGDLLQKLISETYQTEVMFFHGGLSRSKRDSMVESFQNERKTNTLILSLKAGGTGLNLTAAKHVIHFDLWWNPAVEAQATDRAYRIGQKENVMVYRMITKSTFEEKINDMLQEKKELANLTISNGEKWIGEFSNQELKSIFKLGE